VKLLEFQRPGVAFLVTNRRAILADPMGTGKTAQMIRTLQVLSEMGENPFPALVVCPNSLKLSTWSSELSAWAPELTHQVIDGSAAQRRKQLAVDAQVRILNWESVRLHSRLAPYGSISLTDKEKEPKELNDLGLRTVICDEAHKMKDVRAAQTRAVWAVLHEAEFRYLMTGTPIANNIGDLWSLLHGVEPTWFPARTKYLDRWADMSLNYFGGMDIHGVKDQNREEFFKVIDPLVRRIPKEAALPQLPPKLPVQIRHTPMSPKQKKMYTEMRDYLVAQLNDLLVAPNPLSQLIRLSQFASASAEIGEDGSVRLTAPSSKVDDLEDLLEELGDEPLVVAAVSRQLIELAAERLTKLKISHGLVTGAQSIFERQDAVRRFQAGHLRVILLTLGAGAEGITLTRASRMLFMQESFSQVQNLQAEDRVHRIGSEIHDSVQIIKQITPDSMEEHRRDLLEVKGMRMEEVVRDKETLLKLLGVPA
jgi:SNF2 family DNA or RNA helicase